ncbi:peptidase M20 [Spirochaetia bacterium]|nr:peptidase M20 [Spirochaetia bacterium]
MDFIERFREAVKIPTWWPAGAQKGEAAAEAPLVRFQEFLVTAYPAFHKTAERWVLSPYSVIYHWPGSGGGSDSPVLFLAHYDVVPAETEKWSVDPFGAEVKDGFVYGRGTLDMKATLISLMEGAEKLCTMNFKPTRDIWFAFGGDEERAGPIGAVQNAKWLAAKNLRFDWLLDEGTPIGVNQIKGVDSPLALVSIEEKGYLSLALTAVQKPGHASRPPKVQAAAVLAKALCRIAKKPFPFELIPSVERFFRRIGPLSGGIQGFAMRHARLLGPLFFAAAASSPTTIAMLRTTVAMTQLKGSAADNVMPSEVKAVINLRLLPSWTIERAIAFIKKVINDDRVTVSIHGTASEPTRANPAYRGTGQHGSDQPGWKDLAAALESAWPGTIMTPFLMVATTDSRHYKEITGSIFRFNPYKLGPDDMSGIHGHDERISEENLIKGLQFYTKLLESM